MGPVSSDPGPEITLGLDAPEDPVEAAIWRGAPAAILSDKGAVLIGELKTAIEEAIEIRLDPHGSLYVYAGGVWRPDDRRIRRIVQRWLADRYRKGTGETIEDMIRTDPPARLDDLGDSHFVNFRNGMLELSTGSLLAHNPRYGSMTQIPHRYDPAAPASERFERFIKEIAVGPGRIILLEALGYAMLDANPLQRALILTGSGSNGKGAFLRFMRALVGDENTSAIGLHHFSDRFAGAHLYGMLANIGDDIPGTHLKDVATFKAVTGQGKIFADRKGISRIEFTPRAFSAFSANQIPTSSDAGSGYLRRWVPVRLPHYFSEEERELDLDERLELEIPGVIPIAIAALRALLERRAFSPFDQDDLAEFRMDVDPVRAYLAERVEFKAGANLIRSELYKDFSRWKEEEEGIRAAIRAAVFNKRLVESFVERGEDPPVKGKIHGGVRVWEGLTWKGSPPFSSDLPVPM